MGRQTLETDEDSGLPVEGGHALHRAIGPIGLVSIGIGTTIGAGIFTIAGTAAAQYAGPGIILSFVFAGVGCLFAALSYSELASMIPVAGSAYTYAYAALGRFIGWFIGWNLVLEYGISASAVAVSWSGYFVSFVKQLGIALPAAFVNAPLAYDAKAGHIVASGALVNFPAAAIVVLLTAILLIGIRETTRFNNLMVLIKIAVILAIIAFGLPLIHPGNLEPLVPENTTGEFGKFGVTGILRAAGVVFFAYIGFDSVSVAAQEAKNPQRDMPVGIIGTLVICTTLYILMAITMLGLVSYTQMNVPNPASVAIEAGGPRLAWLIQPVNIAAMAGLASVVFMSLYGQTRIFHNMANDGFIPKLFARVHPSFRTPYRGTLIVGAFATVVAGLFPLDILGELVSIGTLAAFVTVCAAVIVLRRTAPNAPRAFKTPWVPLVPLLGILFCFGMMIFLPEDTWIRLAIWTGIGIVIYLVYGMWHAKKSRWASLLNQDIDSQTGALASLSDPMRMADHQKNQMLTDAIEAATLQFGGGVHLLVKRTAGNSARPAQAIWAAYRKLKQEKNYSDHVLELALSGTQSELAGRLEKGAPTSIFIGLMVLLIGSWDEVEQTLNNAAEPVDERK